LVAWLFEPRKANKLKLIHPSRDQVLDTLEKVDGFWFWGHGNDGRLHLGSGESLSPSDIPDSVQLESAELRACYSLCSEAIAQEWLRVAKTVSGFRSLTMEYWGLIHRMVSAKRAG
jgi:hypothetical protein